MNIHKEVNEELEKWKENKYIYRVAFILGIVEEILKRRRRTTLAIGGLIAILVTSIIAFSNRSDCDRHNRSYLKYKNVMEQSIHSELR